MTDEWSEEFDEDADPQTERELQDAEELQADIDRVLSMLDGGEDSIPEVMPTEQKPQFPMPAESDPVEPVQEDGPDAGNVASEEPLEASVVEPESAALEPAEVAEIESEQPEDAELVVPESPGEMSADPEVAEAEQEVEAAGNVASESPVEAAEPSIPEPEQMEGIDAVSPDRPGEEDAEVREPEQAERQEQDASAASQPEPLQSVPEFGQPEPSLGVSEETVPDPEQLPSTLNPVAPADPVAADVVEPEQLEQSAADVAVPEQPVDLPAGNVASEPEFDPEQLEPEVPEQPQTLTAEPQWSREVELKINLNRNENGPETVFHREETIEQEPQRPRLEMPKWDDDDLQRSQMGNIMDEIDARFADLDRGRVA